MVTVIRKLSARMATVFVLYGESSEDDKDIYAYACEAIISTLIGMTAALIIATVLNRVYEGIVFTLIFALLRRYTGGYHL